MGYLYYNSVSFGFAQTATALLLIALTGVLAAAAAYIIGDRSTQSRSPYEHYYNGIMFMLLVLILSLAYSLVGSLLSLPVMV